MLSEEHDEQCKRYIEYFSNLEDDDMNYIFVYLSLEKEPKFNCVDKYICINYQELIDYVIEPCSYKCNDNNNNNNNTVTIDPNKLINTVGLKTDGSTITGIYEGMEVDLLTASLRNNGGDVSTSAHGYLATGDKLNINNKEYKLFTANKKSIFFVAGIFFISYIPYFLYYYPGVIQYDAISCLEQISGYTSYNNHHPILFTLFFGGLWNFGKNVLGNGNYGLAIYTIIQMLATSLVLSILIYYMAKKKIPTKWRIITFLILLLNPLTAMYAVRIEKSMFFTLTMILVVIGIAEIITKKEEFFKKKGKAIIFSILLLVLVLLRNNGIYVILLTLIVMLIACKNIRMKILTVFIVPIIFYNTRTNFKCLKCNRS